MRFYVISIFPESFESYLGASMMKRARDKKHIDVRFYNPRDFTKDKHKQVDDRPFGGGPGMVMKPEPILAAVEKAERDIARRKNPGKTKTIILAAQGKEFTNAGAERLAKNYDNIILIAGHYEGVDARVKKILKAEELSIGPYVLTSGELAAMVVADAVTRRLPGVLGNEASIEESRSAAHEIYTRPRDLSHKGKSHKVPNVLLSGAHADIEEWRGKRVKRKK